jgi:hypothetical protein
MMIGATFFLYRTPDHSASTIHLNMGRFSHLSEENEEEEEEQKAKYTEAHWLAEFKMLRNPITGKIPANYREIELAAAARIPEKGATANPFLPRATGITVQNTYLTLGPNNIAGRSRTLGIDRRDPDILITGGTTGGIFRSTDGGANWTFVSPENDIRSANTIVQDPSAPDTWYCGTGEVYYPTSTADIAGTVGHGVFKSIDNGVTWTKLTTTAGNENRFDNVFDLVHRLAVHPTNRTVFAAVYNRIMRSTDGGASWQEVLGNANSGSLLGSLTEVIITENGAKIFAAFTGENNNKDLAGVWESPTGDPGSWRRIAGADAGQAGHVTGWRPYGQWGRVVLNLNGANNKLFVLYKNGENASGGNPKPEADLFRCDISSGNPANYTWANLSAWVPDEPNFTFEGIDPYTTQFNGFNMSIAVKPDNDNILFIGGTNIHRVHLSETDPAKKFRRMGGYGEGFFPDDSGAFIYPNHHPDVHAIYFADNNDQLYTASDGGIHRTQNSVMADTVRWDPLTFNLQTLQYQFVNINPEPETNADFIIGGAQDNGTLISLNPQSTDPNVGQRHSELTSGDGASAAISTFIKNGNTWKQFWYMSVSSGKVYRADVALTLPGDLDIEDFNEITPSGLGDQGQWRTLFINDPDSTEFLYYANKDRLFRTKSASKVTRNNWTEITGVASTIPADNDLSALAISKKYRNTKYLFMATEGGKVYRLDSADIATASSRPKDITPTGMTAGSYVAGISVNPRNADTVIAVVSNYDFGTNTVNNIFWTGNATSANPTWQVIEGALAPVSSQSCAIVLTNSGVEYYVGTSVGLYSTTSINGNNTQWLNEGGGLMKRAIIRSLVNRHKDNTLVVGTHGNGAFMAKIGNTVVDGGPVIDGQVFINKVYPTFTTNAVQYQVGNMFTIKKVTVQLFNAKGQQLYRLEQGYQDGFISLMNYARGIYFLTFTSEDGKQRHVQKIIKQ